VAKLEGKVAIVTGSGQGIGRGMAIALAKEGAKVVIAEINPETASRAGRRLLCSVMSVSKSRCGEWSTWRSRSLDPSIS